jgi:hypothetical protein
MLEGLSGIVTVVNLLLATLVGVRLLRRGRRQAQAPETALGTYFVCAATLGTLFACVAYGAVAQRALEPDATAVRVLVFVSHVFYLLGTTALYRFTAQVFRPDSAWARRLANYAVAAYALGVLWEVPGDGFAVVILPAFGYWLAFVARVGAFAWVAVEALRYWAGARKRVRLGLADPLVSNRFLLWGSWSITLFVTACTEPAARLIYVAQSGTSTELNLDVVGPIVLATIALTSLLSTLSAVLMVLTFFPAPAYRRWVEARAARQQA